MSLRDYWRRRNTESVRLTEVEVSFLGLKGKWVADVDQQHAAWELYVELLTRIATQPFVADQGLLREALNSLYALFPETRRILKLYGPSIAVTRNESDISFADIAIRVLNDILRPLLSEWHPRLQAHESQRPSSTSPIDHERAWPHYDQLRNDAEAARLKLVQLSSLLAKAAGIEPVTRPMRR
jgi:hypothetical protein